MSNNHLEKTNSTPNPNNPNPLLETPSARIIPRHTVDELRPSRPKLRLALPLSTVSPPKEDPFSERANLLSGLHCFSVPYEFQTDNPSYQPWMIRGRSRLRFIQEQLCVPAGTTA